MADADVSPFPKFDIDKYAWKFSDKDGRVHAERLLAGGEILQVLWNVYNKGEHLLFFGVYLDAVSPVSYSTLIAAVRDTWGWTRFHIPTVAAQTASDDKDDAIMVYNTAKSQQEVDLWIARTVVEDRMDKIDLDELRVQLGPKVVPDKHGDQTWLHFVTKKSADNVDSFGLLIHTDHTFFDGPALKKLTNRFLKRLAVVLSTASAIPDEPLNWGSEAANLAPCFYDAIDVSKEPLPVPTSSPAVPKNSDPYYQRLGAYITPVAKSPHTDYGFKPLPGESGQPIMQRRGVLLTKEESDLTLRKLKSESTQDPSKRFTLAQLTHAALCMVTAADNPPTPEIVDRSMNCWGLTDSTYRMKEPWSVREAFCGYSTIASFMEFPIKLFQNSDGTAAPLNKETLLKVLKHARSLYTAESPRPYYMMVTAQGLELACTQLKAGFKAGVIPPAQSFHFSNDGRGEIHLDPTFYDGNGQPIFEITNHITSVNRVSPAGFYRVSSWKGIIELGVDENTNIISQETSKKRLELWKKFILMVKDFSDKDYD